jgi:hypothetical protein
MRHVLFPLLALCLILVTIGAPHAREPEKPQKRFFREWNREEFAGLDIPLPGQPQPASMRLTAAVDTYTIVYFDFDPTGWEGFTVVDPRAQPGVFWHVEDYLEPELAGLPGPLEGDKSAWCGAPPAEYEYLCGWTNPRGYGNAWDQRLVSNPFFYTNPLKLSFKAYFDSEPGFDSTTVEYDSGLYGWQELGSFHGTIDTIVSWNEIITAGAATKLRFHFVSDGAWSDQDGLWDSDGAAHIDSVTIADGNGLIYYEDFESAPDGAKSTGFWHADIKKGYGSYAGLRRPGIYDKDPCGANLSKQLVFYVGSDVPSTEYPGLYDTPFCKGGGGTELPCQFEIAISPPIDMARYTTGRNEIQDAEIPPGVLPDLGGVYIKYTVYRDLPLQNLVFYFWMVREIENGCPGPWQDRSSGHYYGSDGIYIRNTHRVDDLVEGADTIQVAVGMKDRCGHWYLSFGDCAEHTPSPWFDNIEVQLFNTSGPQWTWYRDMDLFQDNFPSDEGDIESFVRADAANDLNPNDDPVIRPGDSVVVSCESPLGGGIAEDGFGPLVFMHVRVTHLGPDGKMPPSGPVLEGNYGVYYGFEGAWTIIRGDTALTSSGNPAPDRYMFDLNDSLFTRGMMVEYYFKAEDVAGKTSTLPENAEAVTTEYPYFGGSYYFEFTCLPTLTSDILYVDDFHGRGTFDGVVQNYLDRTFKDVLTSNTQPDRYDVMSPSSLVGNSLASRAKLSQLLYAYDVIIWDSGNLEDGTICTGDAEISGKSPDCQLLIDWLDALSSDYGGLWVMGDNVANDLSWSSRPQAYALMHDWCGVNLVDDSYFELTGGAFGGGVMNPQILTVDPGGYVNPFHPDSICLTGGCPSINYFDVVEGAGIGKNFLRYPDFGGESYYAAVGAQRINTAGSTVRTLWFGFSFMYIVDCDLDPVGGPIVRNRMLESYIRSWLLGGDSNIDITPTPEIPLMSRLEQNYPNPFNPSTEIRFAVRDKGHVSLKIYNATGQLVRTLVDKVESPGVYKVDWDGRNNRGSRVASGVYFYAMEAKEFRSTKKMVLLR